MRAIWYQAVAVLTAIWLVAGGVILWARNARSTPEAIVAYVEKNSVEGKSVEERADVMKKVADRLNRLNYEERQEMRMGRKLDAFFRNLTPDEQGRFLDMTLPAGFQQMMDAFNKMEPRKRKEFVRRALNEMRENEDIEVPDEARPSVDDPQVQKIINHGMKSFYSEATAETKMDLAPLIEQMQRNLQRLR